ncbi:glycosyltransferase [Fulvivirgaceae bacterium PWU4]|uniref:Glycosyltransferase n=1 Tax=Chryseosolibacter histidini TaxID=2782349 RepID=A0AAP2GKQ5_9BACT|nr:glycosyltransferase [Chryseosolibacter histidini]MBT1699561.1 glycosyltransferase [Chryseosolibacter histidini]
MMVIAFILLCYCCLVIMLWIGWQRLSRQTVPEATAEQMITVVVAVRNEEKNITRLLNDLAAQQYSHFEVIAVNDHSSDASAALLRASGLRNLVVLENEGNGKKHAITTGVKAAKGSVIVTTDADCSLPQQWLRIINRYFQREVVKFAFGGVRMQRDASFFSQLQAIEFASLIGSGAATAAWGRPTMCNGANLAYRKHAFEAVNGYEGNLHIASGDDEFLMRKIFDRYPDGVCFMASAEVVVGTQPQPDVASFLQQRLRWAAKWKFNSSGYTISLALFILASQLVSLWCLASLVIDPSYPVLFLLVLKAVLEGFFLRHVCRFLKVHWRWPALVLLQLLYPVYVVLVGVTSNFVSGTWKGR